MTKTLQSPTYYDDLNFKSVLDKMRVLIKNPPGELKLDLNWTQKKARLYCGYDLGQGLR